VDRGGKVIWKPTTPGFFKLEVVDGEGRKAQARVRVKAG
jgi:penicillin-binding protein 1C